MSRSEELKGKITRDKLLIILTLYFIHNSSSFYHSPKKLHCRISSNMSSSSPPLLLHPPSSPLLRLPPHRHNLRPPPRRRRRNLRPPPISSSFNPIKLLWPNSLPPSPLISAVRSSWSATWHLMMQQLAPSSPSGSYSRPTSLFPVIRTPAPLPPHLHLYAALPCPWAHRALIARALRSPAIPVSFATPGRGGQWEFRPPDPVTGRRTLREVYGLRPGGYDGRSTVPMLWDAGTGDVACNESYAIAEFFNGVGSEGEDLAPEGLRREMERWNGIIHPSINNGVYRCGFAQSQEAYDAAIDELFDAMDTVEEHLSVSRYLCGDTFTLADICLFTTLIRFDLVYNNLFRCSKKKLVEYPNLHGYTREIYQMPKVAATCDFGAIVDSYYGSLFPLNPSGIRPAISASASEVEMLSKLHGRESISLGAREEATKEAA